MVSRVLPLLAAIALAGACTGQSPSTSTRTDDVTGQPTCVTIQRGTNGNVADTFIKSNALKKNFGGRPHIRVSAKEEGLMRFDLAPVPSSVAITSATLKVYVNGEDGDGTVNLYRVIAPFTRRSSSIRR